MMCYKDMTFCPFHEECAEKPCPRALTEEVIKDAEKWWGKENPPICMYAKKPECFRGDAK